MARIAFDGFDKYGPAYPGIVAAASIAQSVVGLTAASNPTPPGLLNAEWTSLSNFSFAAPANSQCGMMITPGHIAGETGTSISFYNADITSSPQLALNWTLPASYSRLIGGCTICPNLTMMDGSAGVAFAQGSTDQVAICINQTSGAVEVRRGSVAGTLLATSSQSVSAGTIHSLGWDVTFHTSAGAYTVWLDGVQVLTATGQNTAPSGTDSANVFRLEVQCNQVGTNTIQIPMSYDHLFHFDSTTGANNAYPGPMRVETDFPASDSAVQFAIEAGVVGFWAPLLSTTTNVSSAPGANELVLMPVKPAINCTFNGVGILPAATSAGANFKPVLYPDSGGLPDTTSLLSAGSQVTGCTANTGLSLPLTTPQSLTAGTQYWAGYITDISVAIVEIDVNSAKGRKAANTYSSGAPATCPTTTAAQPTFAIWGNVSGEAHNFSEVDRNPPAGILSYVASSTVGNTDQYTFGALSSTPANIASVKLSGYIADSDVGARTVNLEITSGSATGGGSNAGFTPNVNFGWIDTYFDVDPNTSAAWAAAAVNAATGGWQIET